MKRIVLAAGIAMLVVAGCSKPTELASEANAKYDRRDPVVAPPPPDAVVDTTPVEPIPGSPEAEALAPAELQPAPGEGTEVAPTETVEPASPPAETLQPQVETTSPPTDTAPPATELVAPAPTAPPLTEAPPAPAPN